MSNNLFNYFKHESSLPCPSGQQTVFSAMIQAANDSVLSVISTAEESAPECSDGKKCSPYVKLSSKDKALP